ncbi:hypothetical protein [Candidatus Phytoplasma solani]|uniref:hypothetical protein n=1 Tax=Candidatus Phytoplasma solani TaxID=69896 RepID=UPI00358F62CF
MNENNKNQKTIETKDENGNRLTIYELPTIRREIHYKQDQITKDFLIIKDLNTGQEVKRWYISENQVSPSPPTQENQTIKPTNSTNTKTVVNPKDDINKIKFFLNNVNEEFLNRIMIIPHKNKKTNFISSNFHPSSQVLYVDKTILDEIKEFKINVLQTIKTPHTPTHGTGCDLEQIADTTLAKKPENPELLKNKYPIFQHKYRDENRERIKKVLGEINDSNLKELEMRKLEPTKKDKFDKRNKTNYKKNKNILFYLESDKKYIEEFLSKNNKVKKMHPKYDYKNKNEITSDKPTIQPKQKKSTKKPKKKKIFGIFNW